MTPTQTQKHRIPVNDLSRHIARIREAIASSIQRVVDRGWFVSGPEVKAFEAEFAAFCGVGCAIGVGNGTDALELSLRALGIGPTDSVVTTANAGGYTSTALAAIGAHPVYVDVHPQTMTLCPDALSKVLDQESVQAVVVTHLFGKMADMPALLQLTEEQGIPVVEDCAQAHGALLAGRPAGSWGRLGAFSFYPTKNLGALGDGGAVITSDAELAKVVRELREYGWTQKYQVGRVGGRNSRLDEIQAAVLRACLPLLNGWNDRRRAIAARYNLRLAGLGLRLPPDPQTDSVAHLYVVRSDSRDSLRERLSDLGIGADIHYPIPDHKQMTSRVRNREECLIETEACCRNVLTLPCFPELTDDEVEQVADAVRETLHGAEHGGGET